ncbi:MAG: ferredoxin, partial [Clostridia bacterium]|nr:ferredoxin [Clostridia bacterium]
MIYYFSGTGNSRYAAQKLALLTGDKAVNIASIYNGTVKSVVGKSDVTGFVFPVYFSGLPEMVKRFASNPQIRENLGEYVFCVI